MKRRWLRWVKLLLLVEGTLYLAGTCRPYGDYRGYVDRSRPLLLLRKDVLVISVDGRDMRRFAINDELTRKLQGYVQAQNPARAWRSEVGWLLDNSKQVLPACIEERAPFAYNPEAAVLAWRGESHQNLYIRDGESTRQIRTWTVYRLPRINPDGTIWLGEDNPMHTGGIAVLDRTGRFLGWRAKGYSFAYCDQAAEADETVMPLVEKLLARSRDNDSKGF